MKTNLKRLKVIGSITAASLSMIAIPFTSLSVEAIEEKNRPNAISKDDLGDRTTADPQMIQEDTDYINALRDRYPLDS